MGRTLKAIRTRKRLTQIELAKRAKVTQPYIVYLERGEQQINPSLAVLQRLAKALGVPVAKLVG